MQRLIPVLLASVLMTGCTYRFVYGVQDTPIQTASGKPSSIVHTIETKWFPFPIPKDVYYECKNDGGTLDCVKICDVKNEEGEKIRCQFLVGM